MKTPEQIIHDVTEARAAEMNSTEAMYFPEDLAARVAWFDQPGDPLSFVIQAIEADRAQREKPVVLYRDGEIFEGEDVDVMDLGFIDGRGHSEYDQDNIDQMVATLRGAGWDSAADDVLEWWSER